MGLTGSCSSTGVPSLRVGMGTRGGGGVLAQPASVALASNPIPNSGNRLVVTIGLLRGSSRVPVIYRKTRRIAKGLSGGAF
jgi:hypothetical protein